MREKPKNPLDPVIMSRLSKVLAILITTGCLCFGGVVAVALLSPLVAILGQFQVW